MHAARMAQVAVALKQGTGTGQGHRHHRYAGLDGNAERTGLELAGAAFFPFVAGALREDNEAFAAFHNGGGVVQGADGSPQIVALDEYAAQQLHPAVQKRDLFQLFLGKDAVGLIQTGQQKRDVVVAAVVAHKHAGGVLGDILKTLHAQGNAGHL